jgi:hypothetical protein
MHTLFTQSAPTRTKINHPEGGDNTFFQKHLNKSYPKLRKNSKYHHLNNTRFQNPQTKPSNSDNKPYEVVIIHNREQLIQKRAADAAVCGLATSAARRY